MARPSRMLAKLTSKNQLTLPSAAVAALDWPTHFRVQVSQGALVLWPVALMAPGVAAATAAKVLGLDAEAVRNARRAMRDRLEHAASEAPAPDRAGRFPDGEWDADPAG